MLTTLRILSTALFLGILSLAVFQIGCMENAAMEPDPHDASRIEGDWVEMAGSFAPDWHYHFEQGLMTQDYIKAGAVLASLTYPYAVRQDSVIIGGDATNAPRIWVVNFECEDVVEVTQYAQLLGRRFWLKREQ